MRLSDSPYGMVFNNVNYQKSLSAPLSLKEAKRIPMTMANRPFLQGFSLFTGEPAQMKLREIETIFGIKRRVW